MVVCLERERERVAVVVRLAELGLRVEE